MNPLTEGKRIKTGYDYFATGFTGIQLSEAYYKLTADKRQERFLFETATMDEVNDVYNPGDFYDENDRLKTEELLILEAITIQKFARTDTKMAALVRVFNGYLKDKNIEAMSPVIGTPKKTGLFASVTVQIPFSDGQVVSVIFHSPDNNKMKITADDEIIAFRWLLNKRDITHVVSPENDAEISLQEIGKRTAQLVEKNSVRFQVMQKELLEQKKQLGDLKAQADTVVKQHDELVAALKEKQDSVEAADAKVINLKERIEKQKAFNDDLQNKIDALKGKQAGNDGKATGGDTPKTEAEMKAEQERTEFKAKKAEFEQELVGRGAERSGTNDNEFRIDMVGTYKGKLAVETISVTYYVEMVDEAPAGKVVVYAADKKFEAKGIVTANNAFDKAIKAFDAAIKDRETVAGWAAKYQSVVSQFKVGDQYMLSRKTFVSPAFEADDYMSGFSVRRLDGAEAGGSNLPAITFESDNSSISISYDKLQGYLADGSLKLAGGAQDTTKGPTDTTESPAVSVLNDILAGKYDGDSGKLGDALDKAAADLEAEGKAQEFDSLLNSAADHLTELLKKEAA